MKNTIKQVWTKSFYDEPIQHEYDVFTTQNDDGSDVYTLKDTGSDDERCQLVDDKDKMIIHFDNKTIELDYSQAEQLLSLLTISYDTTMEIKDSYTISKINSSLDEEDEDDDLVINFKSDDEDDEDDENDENDEDDEDDEDEDYEEDEEDKEDEEEEEHEGQIM